MLQTGRSPVQVPDEVDFFNPSNRTMALGSTQPLTEMSTRNHPGGKKRPARRADNLTAICEPIVYKMWEPQPLTTLRASKACRGENFTFLIRLIYMDCDGKYFQTSKLSDFFGHLMVRIRFLVTLKCNTALLTIIYLTFFHATSKMP
jgi:hypothetical protein